MEAATRLMSEKDEEIKRLEEKVNSLKARYVRMSATSAAPGAIKIEGNESLAGCGPNQNCNII